MTQILGKMIKKRRLELGYSQAYLSKISGVDPKTISFIERDVRKRPLPETIIKLASALNEDYRSYFLAGGYTSEEVDEIIKVDKSDKSYPFDYEVTIKGHACIDDIDSSSARYNAANAISNEIVNAANENDLLSEIFHDSKMIIKINIK